MPKIVLENIKFITECLCVFGGISASPYFSLETHIYNWIDDYIQFLIYAGNS